MEKYKLKRIVSVPSKVERNEAKKKSLREADNKLLLTQLNKKNESFAFFGLISNHFNMLRLSSSRSIRCSDTLLESNSICLFLERKLFPRS